MTNEQLFIRVKVPVETNIQSADFESEEAWTEYKNRLLTSPNDILATMLVESLDDEQLGDSVAGHIIAHQTEIQVEVKSYEGNVTRVLMRRGGE